jgi:hypothetical protein
MATVGVEWKERASTREGREREMLRLRVTGRLGEVILGVSSLSK